jgi:hypothetical protein
MAAPAFPTAALGTARAGGGWAARGGGAGRASWAVGGRGEPAGWLAGPRQEAGLRERGVLSIFYSLFPIS